LASLFLLLLSTPAQAFRPFDGTDAQVAPLRALETELQPMGYERIGDERLLVIPELALNYGAGTGWEFVAEAQRLMVMNPEAGSRKPYLDDLGLSVKKVLRNGVLQSAKGASIATEWELQLPPTRDHSLGLSAALVATQRWKSLTVHLNGLLADTQAHEFGRFASVIGEFAPGHWPVHPAAELSIEREGDHAIGRNVIAGILWETRPGLTIDAAVRIGRGDEHEVELRSGLTWKKHVPNGPKM
jgi:hypothetical protein